MDDKNSPEVVVEMSGGVVVAIYSRSHNSRIVLLDWDEFEDDGRVGIFFPVDPISSMPTETRRLVDAAI